MHHIDRNSEHRAGGIAFIYKMCLEVTPNKLLKFAQFQYMSCRIIINKMNIYISVSIDPRRHHKRDSKLHELYIHVSINNLKRCKSGLIVVGDSSR